MNWSSGTSTLLLLFFPWGPLLTLQSPSPVELTSNGVVAWWGQRGQSTSPLAPPLFIRLCFIHLFRFNAILLIPNWGTKLLRHFKMIQKCKIFAIFSIKAIDFIKPLSIRGSSAFARSLSRPPCLALCQRHPTTSQTHFSYCSPH